MHRCRAAVAALLIASSALAAPASARAREPRPAIQDGLDDATHTFAVAVCGGSPGSCATLCSGVLLAPNLVVTARHCLEGTNVASGAAVDCATSAFNGVLVSPASLVITTSASTHQSTEGWHAVSRILTPGATQALACNDDVALLVLADVIAPAEATPATPNVATPLTDEAVLEPVETAIGYGLDPDATGDGGTTSGSRRARSDIPILCIPGDPDPVVDCTPGVALGTKEFETGDGVCPGDSGSGAFAQAQLEAGAFLVLGVLSRGAGDASQCVGGTYTRLDLWSDFLIGGAVTAASAGAYAAPAWAGGPPIPLPVTGGCSAAPGHTGSASAVALAALGIMTLLAGLASGRGRRRSRRRLS